MTLKIKDSNRIFFRKIYIVKYDKSCTKYKKVTAKKFYVTNRMVIHRFTLLKRY